MSAVSREMMFYFCEPYFHTLDRWMKYDDRHLLCNRLQVMAALIEILNARYDSETTYEIEQTETDEPLLPAVHPSAGETFCDGYDLHAFHTAGTLVSPAVFQTGGLYFQKNLLRALSFGNASTKENFRDSPAIIALRQLFRLSKESGPASLYSCKYNYTGYQDRDLVPLVDLTPDTWTLHDSLIANMVILKAAAEAKRVAAVASAIAPNFTIIEAEPIEEEVPTVTSSTAATGGAGAATVAATVTVSAQATPNATAMVIDEVHTEQHQQANVDSIIMESNEGMMGVTENIIADADSMFTDGTSCVYSHEGIESGSRADIIPDATGSAMKVTVFEEVPSDGAAHVEVQADVTDKMTVNDAVESDVEDDEYVLLPSSIVILDKNQEVQDPSSEILDKNQNQNSVTSSSSQSAQNDLKGNQSAAPAPITLVAFTLTAVPATAAATAAATLAASTSSSSESATLPTTATTTTTTGATTNTNEAETTTSIAENVSNKSDQTAALSATTNSPKRKRERGSSIDNDNNNNNNNNNNIATEEESGGGRRSSKRVQNDQTHEVNEEKDKEKDGKRNSLTSLSGISSSRSSSRLSVSNESEEKGNASGKKAVRTAVKIIEKRIEGNKEELEKDNAKRRKITKSTGTSKNKNKNNADKNTGGGGEEEEEGEQEEENEEINEEEWLFEHPSIGTKVAGIFQKASRKSRSKTSTVFYGEVTKFLSESGENERDELYHILWEDGDEEDYDTCDLTEGVRRYKLAKKNR